MVEHLNRNIAGSLTAALLGTVTGLASYLLVSGRQRIFGATNVFAALFLVGLAACLIGLGYCLLTWGRFRLDGPNLTFRGVFSSTVDITTCRIKQRMYSVVLASKARRVLIPKKDALIPLFRDVYQTRTERANVRRIQLPMLILKANRPFITMLTLSSALSSAMLIILIASYRSVPFGYSVAMVSGIVVFIVIFFLAMANMVKSIYIEEKEIRLSYYAKRSRVVKRSQVKSTQLSMNYATFDFWLHLNLRSGKGPHKIILSESDSIGDHTLKDLQLAFEEAGT